MDLGEPRVLVIVDTSFLMVPGLFGVDIEKELDRLLESRYELVVPGPVLEELKHLSEHGAPAERQAARIASVLAMRGEVKGTRGPADEAILRLIGEGRYTVGTTDAALRKELRGRGVPVIYLREKSHLAIDGRFG